MPIWFTEPITQVWAGLTPEETRKVERWVERAEAIIQNRFPTTASRITNGTLSLTIVTGIIEDMVTRALEKTRRGGMDKLAYPEVTMEWESDGGLGQGNLLWLTTDEIVLLSPPPGGIFTIRPKARPTYPETNTPPSVTNYHAY
ncbi:MAG: hypothetical protein Q4A82_01065 [Corynebacterium sp.]|nr:hypothetical protein [Corynebacterium sp.]